ncbi:unknown [Feldmannia species virus]|uniref:Uncharacterized protein n=1 Tax=Feldmannia species virus TaxID=39420 RepID=B5LWD7_9PHYC|nr:hypothetical protein FeldSpV_gp048 [Feldmannia species virus]ACH46800.1 unknown [Feldmannia species virus]
MVHKRVKNADDESMARVKRLRMCLAIVAVVTTLYLVRCVMDERTPTPTSSCFLDGPNSSAMHLDDLDIPIVHDANSPKYRKLVEMFRS